jgi:hypothetical protein
MGCIGMLGVWSSRIADRPPWKREPHGLYRWQSQFSEVIKWLHVLSLRLSPDELTTHTAVRMDWMLSGSSQRSIWFLRGVADSDGPVNVRNKRAVITGEPDALSFNPSYRVGCSSADSQIEGHWICHHPSRRRDETSDIQPEFGDSQRPPAQEVRWREGISAQMTWLAGRKGKTAQRMVFRQT